MNMVSAKTLLLLLFGLFLTFDLVAVGIGEEASRFFSKPLLMPLLAGYVFTAVKGKSSLKRLVTMALFFSWVGDILLMYESNNSMFFLLGLSAFLLAHIFYIGFFHRVRMKEKIRDRWLWLPLIAAYYAALIALLYSRLGNMKIPVAVYGLVISFMLLLAMHMLYVRKTRTAGQFMAAGAALFVLSDSILAIDKYYNAFEEAGIIIMFSYGMAQALIITGATRYIQSSKSV